MDPADMEDVEEVEEEETGEDENSKGKILHKKWNSVNVSNLGIVIESLFKLQVKMSM